MKSLFAIIIALFFVSAALAQHTNVANQSGDLNTSVILQLFSVGGTSFDGNVATLDQVGNYNASDIYQINNAFGGSAEFAQVDQFGSYNSSEVDQLNDGHDAFVYQQGNSNISDIWQDANKTYGEVTQVGSSNEGYIFEVGVAGTFAWIRQFGNENYAKQDLGQGWSFSVVNSHFTALQDGNYNVSIQYLEGDLTAGWVGSSQTANNVGSVETHGSFNRAEQIMMDGGVQGAVDFVAEGNLATVYQQGNSNQSYQYMRRNDNTTVFTQVGSGNVSISQQNW